MLRPSVILVTLSMLGAVGGLAYLHATREKSAAEMSSATKQQAAAPANSKYEPLPNAATAVDVTPEPSPSAAEPASTRAVTAEAIAQWIIDTQSTDAKTRAAAIAALAQAPKAQAVPALESVLETGEPEVDRQIALRSLYSLAMQDGDSDGAIRDVMRRAVYHGDDDGVTQTAQALLDDIEAEFDARAATEASQQP